MQTLFLDNTGSDVSTRRSLHTLSLTVAKSRRIIVVTGAGISCSSGIPDFRSSDGLYALVKEKYPHAVLKGRDLFDASLFRDPTSTSVFYTFIAGLKASIDAAQPAPTHRFIQTLDSKSRLLRSYTQNIDGLEERAGLVGAPAPMKCRIKLKLKEIRNVQLHGNIHRVRCTFCSADFPCDSTHLATFTEGIPPDCPECKSRSDARTARSARALKIGTLRPAIVLYDEAHPLGDEIGAFQTSDLSRKPDLLLIMGTSLKVHGLKKLVKEFAKAVHERPNGAGKVIFVNKTPPSGEWTGIIDYHVDGETDAWTERVLHDWKKARPADWEVQPTLFQMNNVNVKKAGSGVKPTQPSKKTSKKQKPVNDENEPPVASTSAAAKLPTVPLSPSKRRRAESSYKLNLEESPSKKRDIATCRPALPERGLLFARKPEKPKKRSESVPRKAKASVCETFEVKASRRVLTEIQDISMTSPEAKVIGVAKLETTAKLPRMQAFVEVPRLMRPKSVTDLRATDVSMISATSE